MKGTEDSGDGDADGGAPDAAHQLQIGLHAREQQQQNHAELGDGLDHRLLIARGREERVLQGGPERPQHRRAEQDAAQELAHHRGLPQPGHDLADQPAGEDQQDDLEEEDGFRGEMSRRLGGEGGCREEAAQPHDGEQRAETLWHLSWWWSAATGD